MGVKEINIRGVLTPEINILGEVQKGSGLNSGMVIKTKEEWAELPQMRSVKGIWYVYSNYKEEEDPETHEIKLTPACKIGDEHGTYVVDLPFTTLPITQEEIDKWNDHVGVIVEGTRLIFYN